MDKQFILKKEIELEENNESKVIYLGGNFTEIHNFDFNNNSTKEISLLFSNCKIRNFDYSISDIDNIKEILFQDCSFEKQDALNFSSEIDLIIRGGTKLKEVIFEYVNSSLFLDDEHLVPAYLFFYGLNLDTFKITDSSYGDLYFKPPTPQISFSYIHLSSFQFCGELLIDNVKIKTLHIENFSPNFDSFEFRNLEIGELIIENSNLGTAIFNSISIGKITIKNSSLNECIFNGVEFKSYSLGQYIKKNFNNKDYKYKLSNIQLKDNYRQLKYMMDKNGNHTEANKFYAKEMYHHSSELGIANLNFFSLFNTGFYSGDSQKIGEKISLVISELISDFGSNLLRVIYMLSLYLIFIYLIIYSTNHTQELLLNCNFFFPSLDIDKKSLSVIQFYDAFSDVVFILGMGYLIVKGSSFFEEKLIKIEKIENINNYFLILVGVIFFAMSFLKVQDFDGINSFIFLLNPLAGFDPEFIDKLVWTEKLGLLLHKIFFATFIYHFIITLRRTTKR